MESTLCSQQRADSALYGEQDVRVS